MFNATKRRQGALRLSLFAACAVLAGAQAALAQPAGNDPLQIDVGPGLQRLEMTVSTSRILSMPRKIPRAQVNNPEILELQPLTPNKIQLVAKKPGVTQIILWDEKEQVQSIDVLVYADARALVMLLRSQFPTASLHVVPLANSVVISGYVARPDEVSRVIAMVKDFYPSVINNITVGGVEQVLLHVKVMEVSRTKLRTLGFDFAALSGTNYLISSVSGLAAPGSLANNVVSAAGDTVRFGIVNGDSAFFGFLEALQRNDLAKILAEPTLVTVSGRPAQFKCGGEFPILVPQSLGTVSIEYKNYGTQVDFVPIVLGEGRIRLEVRPQVSELDESHGVIINNITVPALRVRQVDTGVEMRAGQTLALAGLVQKRTEAQTKGLPILGDMPYFGVPFRRVTENTNEIELLIMVTPELVSAMEPHEVPPCGPGMGTDSPSNWDLYWRGHIEVPSSGPCGVGGCQACGRGGSQGGGPEEIGLPDQARQQGPQARSVDRTASNNMRRPQPSPAPQQRVAPAPRNDYPTPAYQEAPNYQEAPASPAASEYRRPRVQQQAPAPPETPGFIGPLGYDVK
ncbi:MAG: pilus assembly protein N-terminal domain-containing protein [Planctomycetia bacterium]|nr:pilus assembly protein N-terminal domain-containing protein [Planctomycetia bacterium]